MIDLIENATLNFTKEHLAIHVIMILLSSTLMLISMAVDLFFGVKKAKENGMARTSTGFKKTCDKARKYFSPYLVLICIDLIGCVILPVPVFSMLWAAYCVFCEFTSVREKSWQKEELRKAEKTMSVIIENKDDLAKVLAKLITGASCDKKEEKKHNSKP